MSTRKSKSELLEITVQWASVCAELRDMQALLPC